jgi:hypothetical protein
MAVLFAANGCKTYGLNLNLESTHSCNTPFRLPNPEHVMAPGLGLYHPADKAGSTLQMALRLLPCPKYNSECMRIHKAPTKNRTSWAGRSRLAGCAVGSRSDDGLVRASGPCQSVTAKYRLSRTRALGVTIKLANRGPIPGFVLQAGNCHEIVAYLAGCTAIAVCSRRT